MAAIGLRAYGLLLIGELGGSGGQSLNGDETDGRPAPAVPSSRGPDMARENLRGIVAMLGAAFFFLTNDMLAKLASERLPTGEIIFIRGVFASILILIVAAAMGKLGSPRQLLGRALAVRSVGDVGGTVFYLTALFHIPIANATAILQAQPLLMTAASAALLRESVGWRRWAATAVGFIGMLLIVKPVPSALDAWALLAVVAVGFFVLRDFSTRMLPPDVPTLLVAVIAAVTIAVTGAIMMLFETVLMPSAVEFAYLAGAALMVLFAYVSIIVAMRHGEVSVVNPFRYSIILWGLFYGVVIWSELPDRLAMIGIVIIIAAGLYTLHREGRVQRQRRASR